MQMSQAVFWSCATELFPDCVLIVNQATSDMKYNLTVHRNPQSLDPRYFFLSGIIHRATAVLKQFEVERLFLTWSKVKHTAVKACRLNLHHDYCLSKCHWSRDSVTFLCQVRGNLFVISLWCIDTSSCKWLSDVALVLLVLFSEETCCSLWALYTL